ncbi:2OG-Fe(II) oxygenase [Aminobacter anthyllidis]|uniref:2OG-Fe(II) oxygenase n=1 Tax=Aminobacter anthyllidis TaxID=1035067 RepID=A0A9X1A6K8_9HYPH|nr:2OG-Fe(II) oxygenase [Aminobacter anthyllidis]MBT1154138.1 2OG-Fe(II) oxygenase [Aminobacter anthyllidis]
MHADNVVSRLDWDVILRDLDEFGVAPTGPLLDRQTCLELRALYDHDEHFRSRIVMQRHGFGSGEYKYFANPLPQVIAGLRRGFYERLAPFANGWNERMGLDRHYPPDIDAFLAECQADGQTKPTPLLLKYGAGDYNCLHQDVYGVHLFPVQLVILLSDPQAEFEGGEFVMTEQRPRMQSRAEVVPLGIGQGALFAVNDRPKAGSRGDYRVKMRHGVSRIRSGARFTMGVIFHDAK